MPELLDDAHLEQTAVVANSAMNRDRLTCNGRALPRWEFTYAGADAHAGPNYTGQDAVASHYRL
ncbi:hypothetical protein [Nocardia sp. NPDC059239]|uniref:hypothetical protein n=1 Tax=unclassified Nocardia TaxID=2637762 RepID=UPI0036999869